MSVDPAAFTHLNVRLSPEGALPAGSIVEVELDHGRANEMGSPLLDEWEALAAALETGPHRALLTWSRRHSSKGTALFIAGADVTERVGWDDARVKAHVRRQRAVLGRLRRVPVFHVVVVDGVALGWGTEFLLTADYRIAGPGARFGLPETGLGIIPGAGGTSELWSLIGLPQALRLGMTGEQIDSREALRIGLVQETCDSNDVGRERALALAARVALRSPTAVAAFKQGVLDSVGVPAADRVEGEARAYERCVDHGDAAVGRAGFKAILSGEPVAWPERG
ncbi:MAG: enoyl-CoA hydratase/isomerase family protein [Alphaproteobacteria bacterium]|nr:enoyl-CoA hydratase/isomerase family protein [Alphaproteobacteria bacterium]